MEETLIMKIQQQTRLVKLLQRKQYQVVKEEGALPFDNSERRLCSYYS